MSQDNGAHVEDGATTDASLASRAKNPKKSGPKWWLISLIAVIVAVAVVIGVTLAFGGKKDDKSASSSNQYADTVTIGLKLAPTNLDIRNTAGSALDQILIGNVYEGIVARDSKNQVAPAIASSWETSKDGLTYTFHLNKNMTFFNGDKLDAEDVAWSINELIAKGYHDADALAAVSKVEAKDADTAVITLKTPNSNLLWTLTGRAGLVFDKDAKYDLKTQAVGSGPYTVAKFVENSSITLKANEKYWGKNKAKTPTVVVKYLADDNAAVNALKSGDVQVLAPNRSSPIPPSTRSKPATAPTSSCSASTTLPVPNWLTSAFARPSVTPSTTRSSSPLAAVRTRRSAARSRLSTPATRI